MSRPKLLDLFCRAAGAGFGYHMAGFDVDGVDCDPQKHFPKIDGMRFFQADAFEFLRLHGHEYDAIHASPPCQFGTSLAALHRTKGGDYDRKHPNLIPQTREFLQRSGKPYVIENVEGSRFAMVEPSMLCGTMFGLQTDCGAVLRRHRLFETNWLLMVGLECQHKGTTLHVAGSNPWTGHVEMQKTIGIYGGEDGKQGPPGKVQRTISMNGNGAHDHAEESRRRTI